MRVFSCPNGDRSLSTQKVVIDPVQLGKLAELCCSIEEVAAFFRCSPTTIRHRIKRDPLKTVWEVGMARGAISLRRAQLQAAYAGDRTMLVWLGKQILGQVDKVEQSIENKQRFVVEIPPPMTANEWMKSYGKASDDASDVNGESPAPTKQRGRRTAKVISTDYRELADAAGKDET